MPQGVAELRQFSIELFSEFVSEYYWMAWENVKKS